MQTIKIFLASSEELAEERIRFGDFIRQLDDTYEERGCRIKLFKWEDFPSGDDGRPKQEEYNDKVRESDMFVGLFFTKAGAFTLEEYDTAKATQRSSGRPTLYIFCRELDKGQQEDPSLTQFKEKLSNEIRYYWNNYSSSDSLQLHFVMQLLKVENSRWDDLKVENGSVRLGEMEIARMDNLRFASDNKEYQTMSRRLKELPEEIEDARLLADEHPDKERYKDKLQRLLDERERLRKAFDKQQQLLLDAAINIIKLQGESLSENRKRAEEAFERGDLQTAISQLKEAERNGDAVFEDFERNAALLEERRKNVHQTIDNLKRQAKMIMKDESRPIEERLAQAAELERKADHMAEVSDFDRKKNVDLLFEDFERNEALLEERRKNIHQTIAELLLQATTIMADVSRPIEERIAQAKELYQKADHRAEVSDYDKEKYSDLLSDYAEFLYKYGHYKEAEMVFLRQIPIAEELYGIQHPATASSYNYIGLVYKELGDYEKALEYYFKTLAIREKALGTEHSAIATSYNNIGLVYKTLDDFNRALEYYFKALAIKEKVLGTEHSATATSYNNIGMVYYTQGDYEKALEYHFKALAIREKVLGREHSATATSYNNIGLVYKKMGDYNKALEYYFKALAIKEKVLGTEHSDTSTSYNNIGLVYKELGDYNKALEYYFKALAIREKVLGTEHSATATSYNNIGMVYYTQSDYEKALEYLFKALAIRERALGIEHPSSATTYNNIGAVYQKQKKYDLALEYCTKAYLIRKKKLGEEHPFTKNVLRRIEKIKKAMG